METVAQTANVPAASLADWIFQRLNQLADKKGKDMAQIFADDGSSWTYEKLFQSSVKVAAGLKSMGINPGDMASVVARNTHELYAVVLGCVMSGVIIAASIPELQTNELMQNFLVVNPQIVIAGAPQISTVNEVIAELNPKPKVFEVQQLYRDALAKSGNVDPNTFKPVRICKPKSHVFACLFSSGTTGPQKAVGLTDYGILRSAFLASKKAIPIRLYFGSQDRSMDMNINGPFCNASQIFWVSWWIVLFRGLIKAWTRIVMDNSSAVSILDALHKHKASVALFEPSLLAAMANALEANPGRWDISSMRYFITAGDVCKKLAHENLMKRLRVPINQEYGSTECCTILQGRLNAPVVPGSAGKPVVPIKLVDLTTRKEITEPNKIGEIVIGWIVFHEYVNNPEATADSFDENGWFKSGDIAYFDESGNYFIEGRIKEMFKYCNHQIAPSELEELIKKLPGVKDVAVVGKYVGIDVGEFPTAFVVKCPNSNITEKDILDHMEKLNLHDSKRLRGGVIFKDEIPRTFSGKIARAKVRAFLDE